MSYLACIELARRYSDHTRRKRDFEHTEDVGDSISSPDLYFPPSRQSLRLPSVLSSSTSGTSSPYTISPLTRTTTWESNCSAPCSPSEPNLTAQFPSLPPRLPRFPRQLADREVLTYTLEGLVQSCREQSLPIGYAPHDIPNENPHQGIAWAGYGRRCRSSPNLTNADLKLLEGTSAQYTVEEGADGDYPVEPSQMIGEGTYRTSKNAIPGEMLRSFKERLGPMGVVVANHAGGSLHIRGHDITHEHLQRTIYEQSSHFLNRPVSYKVTKDETGIITYHGFPSASSVCDPNAVARPFHLRTTWEAQDPTVRQWNLVHRHSSLFCSDNTQLLPFKVNPARRLHSLTTEHRCISKEVRRTLKPAPFEPGCPLSDRVVRFSDDVGPPKPTIVEHNHEDGRPAENSGLLDGSTKTKLSDIKTRVVSQSMTTGVAIPKTTSPCNSPIIANSRRNTVLYLEPERDSVLGTAPMSKFNMPSLSSTLHPLFMHHALEKPKKPKMPKKPKDSRELKGLEMVTDEVTGIDDKQGNDDYEDAADNNEILSCEAQHNEDEPEFKAALVNNQNMTRCNKPKQRVSRLKGIRTVSKPRVTRRQTQQRRATTQALIPVAMGLECPLQEPASCQLHGLQQKGPIPICFPELTRQRRAAAMIRQPEPGEEPSSGALESYD